MANSASRFFAVDDLPHLRGQEFYVLGNSLSFEISGSADFSDGLQVSEFVGDGPVFRFDALSAAARAERD